MRRKAARFVRLLEVVVVLAAVGTVALAATLVLGRFEVALRLGLD